MKEAIMLLAIRDFFDRENIAVGVTVGVVAGLALMELLRAVAFGFFLPHLNRGPWAVGGIEFDVINVIDAGRRGRHPAPAVRRVRPDRIRGLGY
jgi:hypothetical protein